jgi:uncharacterized membrane protein
MERTTNRNLWIGIGLLAVLVLFALPLMGGGLFIGRGFDGPFGVHPLVGTPWFWGFGLIALFVRIAIWGGLIFLFLRLFRGSAWRRYNRFDRYDDVNPHDLPAGEILRRRYAAGEITREQYDEMRRTIEPTA